MNFSVPDGQMGFVNLNTSAQAYAVRSHHGSPEPMQHCPGDLKCADALFLIGQIPQNCISTMVYPFSFSASKNSGYIYIYSDIGKEALRLSLTGSKC